MKPFHIESSSKNRLADLKHKIDFKTKPLGALGLLEELAVKIGCIQNTLSPTLTKPAVVVFAGDHGVVKEGVSAYPQEVTFQMVMNFMSGGAAINVFCRQHNIQLKIVDAGVNYDFPAGTKGISGKKTGKGTRNFSHEPAMSPEDAERALLSGAEVVQELHVQGTSVVGFGEMGIGNTASASALMASLTGIAIEACTGSGTGINDEGLRKKTAILRAALAHHPKPDSPLQALATFGGFEIAQMTGAMLQAAENKMVILVDGFIAGAAFLVAQAMHPNMMDYAIFCHQSGEQGHSHMLDYLNARAVLNLNMRLGEGTGAAVAYPLIVSAVAFLNEMASFDTAGVSTRSN